MGDFNQWQPTHTPLQQERDGSWRVSLELPIGQQYHFYYVIDGEWRGDGQADGFSPLAGGGPLSRLALN